LVSGNGLKFAVADGAGTNTATPMEVEVAEMADGRVNAGAQADN
jgi:hypothetical protein